MAEAWGEVEHWRRVLAASRQLSLVTESDGKIIAASEALCETVGMRPSELEDSLCCSILHSGGRPDNCPLSAAAELNMQQCADLYSDVLGKQLFVTVTPLPGTSGLYLHMAADRTEQQRIEGALRESEALLRESQHVAGLGHLVYDIPAGTWTSSAALDELYGIGPGYPRTVEGWLEIIHPDDREEMQAYLEEWVLRGHHVFDREHRIRRIAGGEVRWVRGRASLKMDAGGQPIHLFGVVQDVTQLREERARLQRSARLLEDAESLAHLGSWEWNLETDTTQYSKEWQRIYGVSSDDLCSRERFTLVHPADAAMVSKAEERARTEGLPYHAQHRIIRRSDGEVRHVEVFGHPTKGPGGSVSRIYGAALDVTSRVNGRMEILASKTHLRKMVKGIVRALAMTVEMRDSYTAGHQQRVAELALAIATILGWSDERGETLQTAALLHDIGKIIVPAEILTKPSRLSDTEFSLIKAHALAGGEILESVEFRGPVREAIIQHHERLDGSGYPHGLKGDAIIPEARVLTVADVFEAMVSHRPYRPAFSREAAVQELREGAGIRYDAQAVDACLHLIETGFTFTAASS